MTSAGRGALAAMGVGVFACAAMGQCLLVPTFDRSLAVGSFVGEADIGGLDVQPAKAWSRCRPSPVVDPRYRVVDHRLLPQYDPESWASDGAADGAADEAVVSAATAEAQDPMGEVEALLRSSQRIRALCVIEAEMRSGSEDARLWRGAGALLLGSGKLAEAAQRLHEAHSVDPTLALAPMDVELWFRGGEREARRRAAALRRMAQKHNAPSHWVGVAAVSMWCGDEVGAGDAIDRARAAGADGVLCDHLAWGLDATASAGGGS